MAEELTPQHRDTVPSMAQEGLEQPTRGPRVWLHQALHPGSRLSQRVIHAGVWSFALRITLRLFTTARTIILARLLSPADFGIIGIAQLMMLLLESFSRTGFQAALIQRQGDIRPYLDTAWTIQIVRGFLLTGVMFLVAPLIAAFFKTPAATSIIQVMSFALLIHGFNNAGIIYFEKDLEFQKRFLYRLADAVPQVGVGIGLALAYQSVWALVFATLAGKAVQVVASYLLHPYRPRLRLEWTKAKELYDYGKWVFGSGIVLYFLLHLDDIIVGRLLGPVALGLYRMAYTLSQMVSSEITTVINQVTFPAFSKLQGRQEKLREAYLRTLQLIAFVTFPISAGLFLVAPPLTALVLGEKWLPMVPAFQILVVWGLVRSLSATTGPLFQGIGRPDRATKLQLIKLFIVGAIIYPMTITWGLTGAASAVILGALIVDGVALCAAYRLIDGSSAEIMKGLTFPIFNTAAMFGAVLLAQRTLSVESEILQLIGAITLGVLVYGLGVLVGLKFFAYTAGGILTRRQGKWLTL